MGPAGFFCSIKRTISRSRARVLHQNIQEVHRILPITTGIWSQVHLMEVGSMFIWMEKMLLTTLVRAQTQTLINLCWASTPGESNTFLADWMKSEYTTERSPPPK